MKNIGLGFGQGYSITSRRIPELDSLEVVKVNPKTVRVKFNSKDHILTITKDTGSIISSAVGKTSDGKDWFSYASDIWDTLEARDKAIFAKPSYSRVQNLVAALYKGIKSSKK